MLRYPDQDEGPFIVRLYDGIEIRALDLDGGGGFMNPEEGPEYEIHGHYEDGEFLCIPQDQVEKVTIAATGEEVEFGNPFRGEHPRAQELPEDDPPPLAA